MAQFARALDTYQGYNYKKDKQSSVGFITELKIGDTTLTADQTCKDPTSPETDLKAVAVLNHFLWNTGTTDALYFSGQISTANKQNVAMLVLKDLVKVEVTYKYKVYDYDPAAKAYFLACDSQDSQLKGMLEKNGSELNLAVADDPSAEVQIPENYTFQIGIKPQPEAQSIHIATAQGKNVVKAWGVTVG